MPNSNGGHIEWRGWSFDWIVSDREGLSLMTGFYRGVQIFGKLSMPVIRVKYRKDGGPGDIGRSAGGIGGAVVGAALGGPAAGVVGFFVGSETNFGLGAGPYDDHIYWKPVKELPSAIDRFTYGLVQKGETNNEYVGIVEFTQNDIQWLSLNVYARIGAYHILQEWYISETGTITPRVGSMGLTINMDHWHHPYWRFDFDIDGPDNNRVWIHQGLDDWFFYPHEANDIESRYFNPVWVVRNEQTNNQVWIIPGPDNAQADGFSQFDVAIRRYHPSEDSYPWPFGKGELGFHESEDVSNADVVFWMIAHLFHRAPARVGRGLPPTS